MEGFLYSNWIELNGMKNLLNCGRIASWVT